MRAPYYIHDSTDMSKVTFIKDVVVIGVEWGWCMINLHPYYNKSLTFARDTIDIFII
jgi:hypothetical protein